jgi:hypothetical protein
MQTVETKTKEQVVTKYPIDALGVPGAQWVKPFTQQGDCIIKKCGTYGVFETEHKSIPSDAKEVAGNLVLKGQTNSHALFFGEFKLYEKNGVVFLKVFTPTILDHVKDAKYQVRAEHHAQWIPQGEYFVDDLLEYDHLREEARRVID